VIFNNLKGIHKMKNLALTFLLFALIITLTSCGGGGGGATGGGSGPTPENGLVVTVTPVLTSLPANTLGYPIFVGSPFLTQVNVRTTFANGQEVATGTVVHLQSNNAIGAFISIPDDPETEDVNEFAQGFVGVNQETVGATASFFIHSGPEVQTVTFTATATHPTSGRGYSKNLNFNITEGPDPAVQQLLVTRPRNDIPANSQNIEYFNGSPFVMDTDVQFRDVFGNFTNPELGASGFPEVEVSVSPSNVMYFTTTDYEDTTNIDEFTDQRLRSLRISAGHGPMFLWARDIPGSATVSLSALEAGSGLRVNYAFNVEVVNDGSNPALPTDISLISNNSLYTNGSGGNTNQNINLTVNSGNVPVLDPQVNNIKLSIITDAPNSGEKLSAVNAFGSSVQGTSINIATVNGIANALINSGTNSNTITLTATIDRADNNVDNGIQDGISTVSNYIVSDGVLWALELTSPALDSLTVNGSTTGEGADLTYDFQDGTYSLVISAIGTDKGGNPALPQTLQFGMINSPIAGYPENGSGFFVHSASDGDPQEGGRVFTSISGGFLTAAGGVQPNDTLVVFGEESLGNEDLESAVTVSSVNSQTNLSIVEVFNRNDSTGTINNDFGILPYAIGRAVDGNIQATAVINENGVATTRLVYPVSQLGRIAAVYVKGQGSINNGVAKSVTDVELTAFPGVEGFNDQNSTLTVSPNIIPSNIANVGFVVCIADSARNPLPGRYISFSYVGGNGQGTIDGQSGAGVMNAPTGADGCTVGAASTTGVIPGISTDAGFNFFAGSLTCDTGGTGGQSVCLIVEPPGGAVLNANPSSFLSSGTKTITLTLYDGSGTPITGASIAGECDQVSGGSLGIVSGPSLTDSQGQSIVRVSAALDAPDGGLDGTCTFTTASGEPTVDVNFTGGDSCTLLSPSPTPPFDACTVDTQFSVGGDLTGLNAGNSVTIQNNGTDSITLNQDSGFTFPLQDDNTAYNVSVSIQPVGQTCTVTNGSGSISGSHVTNVGVTCN